MSNDNGFKPMQWDCERQGCFNIEKRLKFEVFKDCLPGKISFTDIDAIVEVSHNLLLMEWKGHQEIGRGQRLMFERLTTSSPVTVFIVEGDAKTMDVASVAVVWRGKVLPRQESDLSGLKDKIKKWVRWAQDYVAMPLIDSNIPTAPPF